MIIQTVHTMKVGEVVHGGPVSDATGVHKPLTFQVLRPATEQEFRDFCASQNAKPPVWPGPNFYLVSAD